MRAPVVVGSRLANLGNTNNAHPTDGMWRCNSRRGHEREIVEACDPKRSIRPSAEPPTRQWESATSPVSVGHVGLSKFCATFPRGSGTIASPRPACFSIIARNWTNFARGSLVANFQYRALLPETRFEPA